MILAYQEFVKASKIAHISIKLVQIFDRSMNDKTTYLDSMELEKYHIKENTIYKEGGFLGTLKFVGYLR